MLLTSLSPGIDGTDKTSTNEAKYKVAAESIKLGTTRLTCVPVAGPPQFGAAGGEPLRASDHGSRKSTKYPQVCNRR